MKKFIKRTTAAITLLSVLSGSVLTVWGDEVQLTDYRYENGVLLENGYSVFNYYEPYEISDGEITPSEKMKLPSVIFGGKGKELSPQGQYYVNYQLYKGNEGEILQYPQLAAGHNSFILHNIDDDTAGVLFETRWGARQVMKVEYESKDVIPFSDKFSLALSENGETTYLLDSEGPYALLWTATPEGLYMSDGFYISANEIHVFEISCDEGVYTYSSTDDSYGHDYYGKFTEDEMKAEGYTSPAEYISHIEKITINHVYADEYKGGVETYSAPYLYLYLGLSGSGKLSTAWETENNGYVIKTKNIGGRDYYALFKELDETEKSEDYYVNLTSGKDIPSAYALSSIKKMREAGFLFNNASVRYTDNISRLDFAILAAEVFCKAKGVEIDEYIDQNNISLDFDKFTDTENAYVLLANKLGILNGTSETEFSPARGITRQEAAVMINNLAGLLGLSSNSDRQYFSDSSYFADWAREAIYNVSSIRNSEGTALMTGTEENKFSPWMVYSREQAYVTLWRLYETAADK